ncbi:hypothetical protein HAT2_00117 [Candidatus Similichlamydia laticola]|uniref:Uncharacterized protein n=1 Tax=Candidatus Similichlamydia laticola TaxID=2170265 RepID=A0A369KFQ6_9BACT|nr:hypothetical protein HAT2_00117 [Candidatus Similichlamydia laticola]
MDDEVASLLRCHVKKSPCCVESTLEKMGYPVKMRALL